jgi:transcriptional regulator with XRE-family HTH domain
MTGTLKKQDCPYVDFGRRLTNLRKLAGLSRAGFAKECGVAVSSMQNYENGLRLPQADVLQAMAAVLRMSMDSLMDPDEIEADRLEAEGFEIVGEALSRRQKARLSRNMRETKDILYAGGLSPVDTQAYVLSMQRMLLDVMEHTIHRPAADTDIS